MGEVRKNIAKRAALEISNGMVVNLGIGIPSLVPNFLPNDISVWFQAENGILGMGPTPVEYESDENLCNAAGYPVTVLPGASFFDSAISFGMIRKGCIDVTILGALQVSKQGDLANWLVPGKKVPGVGGAMELAYGAKKVVVVMTHCDKEGISKIVDTCTLPLTMKKCVTKIITEKAVLQVRNEGLFLEELLNGTTKKELQELTLVPIINL